MRLLISFIAQNISFNSSFLLSFIVATSWGLSGSVVVLNFTTDQRAQLAELLAEENRSMWSSALYGIGVGDGDRCGC